MHEQRYNEYTSRRKIVRERKLRLENNEHPVILNNLITRGWRMFAILPVDSSSTICREFYANAYNANEGEERRYVSYVRGREIPYDPMTIQEILETTYHVGIHGGSCAFQDKINEIKTGPVSTEEGDEDETYDAFEFVQHILEVIAFPGQDWDPIRDGTKPRRLFMEQLRPEAKVWQHFTVSNVLPVLNLTEVNMTRAAFIYTMMTGGQIDLPTILAESMYTLAHTKGSTASIAHSSFIQKLCLRKGVVVPPERELTKVLPVIDAVAITFFEGERPPPNSVRNSRRRAPKQTRRTTQTGDSSELWQTVQEMRREQAFTNRRVRYMQHSQQSFQDYVCARLADLCQARDIRAPSHDIDEYSGSEEEAAYYASRAAPSSSRTATARGADEDAPTDMEEDD